MKVSELLRRLDEVVRYGGNFESQRLLPLRMRNASLDQKKAWLMKNRRALISALVEKGELGNFSFQPDSSLDWKQYKFQLDLFTGVVYTTFRKKGNGGLRREEVNLTTKWEGREVTVGTRHDLVRVVRTPARSAVELSPSLVRMIKKFTGQTVDSSMPAGHPDRLIAQMAAKAILCDIGDNAGNSTVEMTMDDVNRMSQMLINGHIRNACRFEMKKSGKRGIRAACVVNGGNMKPHERKFAQNCVDLMNSYIARNGGNPITWEEYVALAI